MSRSWWHADPRARIEALVDAGSFQEAAASRASPYLARWGIQAREDDGVVTGRAALAGRPVLVAAQDARFLGGSIGAGHGAALAATFEQALAASRSQGRPRGASGQSGAPAAASAPVAGVLLLFESGGARLHEANPAEVALARALRALTALRVAGVPVLALAGGTGGCFGAAAILAGAGTQRYLRAGIRFGVSGPRAVEAARGRAELHATDDALVDALYGAAARFAQGAARALPAEAGQAREVLARALDEARPLDSVSLRARLAHLRTRWTEAYDSAPVPDARPPADGYVPFGRSGRVWVARGATVEAPSRVDPDDKVAVLAPIAPAPAGPAQLLALDEALLDWLDPLPDPSAWTLWIVEDSPGHEVSARAERVCLAEYLATHALVVAWLRARGVRVLGLLAGTGHSAAFYVNALQAGAVRIVEGSRLEAMAPAAMARVLGLTPEEIDRVRCADPVLGTDARALVTLGGAAGVVRSVAEALCAPSTGTPRKRDVPRSPGSARP